MIPEITIKISFNNQTEEPVDVGGATFTAIDILPPELPQEAVEPNIPPFPEMDESSIEESLTIDLLPPENLYEEEDVIALPSDPDAGDHSP
ncbi:hypothetical protein HRM2_05720 [Desulforapulum autotrophicum HRM2]|uniref:Uncharacterized protein n=1 Tax=Desulforapulum autotrophicum (strain ATCC 43914 / DSM 3382 / VKM B-1955 / HRM2) TaxID=177437 RepID=C0QHX8_DESAH|nr:hypothetical protein HRM2_05720 [Desulforapulum autotrophicum HRM2]